MLAIKEDESGVLLPVKVVPGASRTRYLGEWDGHARIAVSAAPEKGKANEAVIEFIAGRVGVSRRIVSVAKGSTNPIKLIRIEGVPADTVRRRLQPGRS